MTTATTTIEAAVPASGAQGSVQLRRAPKSPALATLLLVVWGVLLSTGLGIFSWSLAETGAYDGWDVKGWVVLGVLLNWGLLFWRAKVLMGLDRRVRGAGGMLCLRCHAPLKDAMSGGASAGVCQACAEPFEVGHTRRAWARHMP